jgi:predicted ATP-grasp superfamily ATP-dependent carboligase
MVNNLFDLDKSGIDLRKPIFMVAGFNQWANAGNVSTGVTQYLIEKLNATKVGHIHKNDFYFFQFPGSHSVCRPPLKYVAGYEEYYQEEPQNDFYYAEIGAKGLIIFLGTEPNQREDLYVNTLLDAASELGVKRIIVPAGVGGEIPFDRERLVSCTYSLKPMQEELYNYGFSFSNYGGNATICMVINHHCKKRGIESVRMSARTPNYEFSLAFSSDKRAMYDILRRIRYMFGINLDLSDIEKESQQQIADFEKEIKRICLDNPELEPKITRYLEQVRDNFQENKFKESTKIPDVFLKEFK